MAPLTYSAICSLDGYIEDIDGKFDWAVPDKDVHRFINHLERGAGTYIHGRRMYETMMGWETDPNLDAESPLIRDFAKVWMSHITEGAATVRPACKQTTNQCFYRNSH